MQKIKKSKRHFQAGCWSEAPLGYYRYSIGRYRIGNPPQHFEISTDTNIVGYGLHLRQAGGWLTR